MNKHTHGPLVASTVHGEGRTLHLVMAEGPTQIASCLTHADAVLFAAAPDMLAALEIVADLRGFEDDEPYGRAVLAAIAKASGES